VYIRERLLIVLRVCHCGTLSPLFEVELRESKSQSVARQTRDGAADADRGDMMGFFGKRRASEGAESVQAPDGDPDDTEVLRVASRRPARCTR
jgi:hypothetical protein